MKLKPIEIDIENKRLYAQVAFLVDNDSFLKDIQEVRQRFHIDPTFQKANYFEKSSDDELAKIKTFDLSRLKNKTKISKQQVEFFKKVAEIRGKYKYPPYFDDIIIQAILFNKTRSAKTTFAILHITDGVNLNHDLEMAILLSPISTKKEVNQAFEEATSLMKDYKKYHPLTTKIKMRKGDLKEIERDRDWFWKNINGQSPHDIAITDNGGLNKYKDIKKQMKYAGDLSESVRRNHERYLNSILNYEEMVRKAINRYKDNLTTR